MRTQALQSALASSEQSEERHYHWCWFPLLVLLHTSMGVAFFACQEDWNFIDAVYFTVLTLTTIGTAAISGGD